MATVIHEKQHKFVYFVSNAHINKIIWFYVQDLLLVWKRSIISSQINFDCEECSNVQLNVVVLSLWLYNHLHLHFKMQPPRTCDPVLHCI